MYLTKSIFLAVFAQALSATAVLGYGGDSEHSLYAREAYHQGVRDALNTLVARSWAGDMEDDFELLYARDADAQEDGRILQARGFEGVRTPGGSVGRLATGFKGVLKADNSLDQKKQREAYHQMPTMQQRVQQSNAQQAQQAQQKSQQTQQFMSQVKQQTSQHGGQQGGQQGGRGGSQVLNQVYQGGNPFRS